MAFWCDFWSGVAKAFASLVASFQAHPQAVVRRDGETDSRYALRCDFIARMNSRNMQRSNWVAVSGDIWLALEKKKNGLP